MWFDGTFILDNIEYWWQAKVFLVGSHYGINGGTVSKLTICKGNKWDWNTGVWLYNYDRRLDFVETSDAVVAAALKAATDAGIAYYANNPENDIQAPTQADAELRHDD